MKAKRPAGGKLRKRRAPAKAASAAPAPENPAQGDDASLDSLLSSDEPKAQQPQTKAKLEKPQEAEGGETGLDELLLPGMEKKEAPRKAAPEPESATDRALGAEVPAPKAVSKPVKAARSKLKGAEPDDAALLDDLLKP